MPAEPHHHFEPRSFESKRWHRILTEEGETVEQIIESDELGNLWGFEIYEGGRQSDRVSLNSRTLPLGFHQIERSGFTEIT